MTAFGTGTAHHSSFPNSLLNATSKFKNLFRRKTGNEPRRWKPPALHPFTLGLAILTPVALIVTLVLLLKRSQRDNGIIFAPDINTLPLSQTFMYQYFPTILAVLFSIFWSWIDLEFKRLEPWYRLSREEGALGKDSLLLSYPFGFVPLVPLRAFKNKHWTVFWASLALVLVTWGLVPTQSGIFSTVQVSRTFSTIFNTSTSSVPAEAQPQVLDTRYAQSTYGILVLNETFPPYMGNNYTLAPFKPSSSAQTESAGQGSGQWTASTTLYSLDLQCEVAPKVASGSYNSSNGCFFGVAPSGNDTIESGPLPSSSTKGFSAQYVGYYDMPLADFYLKPTCPKEQNHTFFAAFTRNKRVASDPPQNVTAIFCVPRYYSQDVSATVDSVTKHPISFDPLGPKSQLGLDIFNSTWMEQQLNGGYSAVMTRGNALPDTSIPNYVEQVADMDLSWISNRQPMLGLAVVAGDQKELKDYLDWETLANAYAKAYGLLFSRAMVDVLQENEFAETTTTMGKRTVETEAVILEPVFTYIVIGFLSLLTIIATILFYQTVSTKAALYSDPGTIASIMGLVAHNQTLLEDFEGLDCCTNEDIAEIVAERRYKLVDHDYKTSIMEIVPTTGSTNRTATRTLTLKHAKSLKAVQKPVRPKEFTSWMSILIISLFIGLAVSLAVLYIKSASNGIALPSQNKFVQNLLENYIPTAIATLIEPIWVLVNRLLCLLQPIEELQGCDAKAEESIDIAYGSLPPQLVLGKALRAGHLILAAVCTMALLANLLAIAFAGLFHHQTVDVQLPFRFNPTLDLKFVSINGSIGPGPMSSSLTSSNASGAYRGGNGHDQFFVLESNYTKNTALLAWTDNNFFYLPFLGPSDVPNSSDDRYEAETIAFGAELDCQAFAAGSDYAVSLSPPPPREMPDPVFNNTILGQNARRSTCISNYEIYERPGPHNSSGDFSCQRGPVAYELSMPLDPANWNASQAEKNVCWESVILGWIRNPKGSCETPKGLTLNSQNSFFVKCKPRLVRGRGTIRVDKKGHLVEKVKKCTLEKDFDPAKAHDMFENDPMNLIGQSNRYIFNTDNSYWHNDSFAVDFINYFIQLESNSSRLLDPKSNVPTLSDVQEPLNKAYASLFAAWLGANKEHLLVAREAPQKEPLMGLRIVKEERLFLSTALFAIAEGILCIYAIAACLVYLRRPGKYLARLPTSIASVIPLFAGSTAVRGMQGLSQLTGKLRSKSLEQIDYRYGYGSFVGVDGRVHIGIEKAPLVRPWKKTEST